MTSKLGFATTILTLGAALLDEKQDAEVMGTTENIADDDVSMSAQV